MTSTAAAGDPAASEADAPPKRRRMSKAARREQLLEAAAELLAEQGAEAFSMDRLAAQAGVNKALTYRHFDNADAVITELLNRHNQTMATRVLACMVGPEGRDEKVRAAIGAFFDVVEEHGPVITELVRWSPPSAPGPGRARTGEHFLADVLVAHLGVPQQSSLPVASVLMGVLMAAVESCAIGDASRSFAERLAAEAALSLFEVAPPEPRP